MLTITLSEILAFAVGIFSILNPLGAIPIYLTLTKDASSRELRSISTRCSLTVFTTIIVSLFLGSVLLDFFNISIPSFRVGGGLLLFSMSFGMLQAKRGSGKMTNQEIEDSMAEDVGIIPLAIPLLAGPGTISASIVYGEEFHTFFDRTLALFVVALIAIAIKIILHYARHLGALLGTTGLNVMSRIMGLILMAMSIEICYSGIKVMFPALVSAH